MSDDKIELECGACQALVRGPSSAAGRKASCPSCGQRSVFDVRLDLAPAEDEAPDEPPLWVEGADSDERERDDDEDSAAFAPPEEKICPRCNAIVKAKAALCIECGLDQRLGMSFETVETARATGSLLLGTLVGLGVAILGGLCWAILAVYARLEIGYLALAIGGATAFAVSRCTSERSARTGFLAVGLTIFGLILGKILIVNWTASLVAEDQFLQDKAVLKRLLLAEKTEAGLVEENVAEAYLSREPPDDPELKQALGKLEFALISELRKLSLERKRALIQGVVDAMLAELSYWDRVKQASSLWDLLWIALALAGAWKILAPNPYE